MEIFQLRLRNLLKLDDLVDELAHNVWRFLGWQAEFSQLDSRRFPELQRGIRAALSRHVRRYDTCGTHGACDDGIEPAAWSAGDPSQAGRRFFVHEPVTRLCLEVQADLDEILASLELEIFRIFLSSPEQGDLSRRLAPELESTIKEVLGPHVFQNLSCGTAIVCRARRPIDPWSPPSHS